MVFDIKKASANIRAERARADLTQAEVAASIGVTQATVNSWEKGASMPNAESLYLLAELFKTSTDALLCHNV